MIKSGIEDYCLFSFFYKIPNIVTTFYISMLEGFVRFFLLEKDLA